MGVKKRPNQPKNFGKASKSPRRPFEKERLDSELKLVGEYGLKNKRELRRIHLTLAKVRAAARKLLMLPSDDPRRTFEGAALVRRLTRLGILKDDQQSLENCLAIKVEDFLKRRLQTLVRKVVLGRGSDKEKDFAGMHHARVLIYQRHIQVGSQVVTSPSFLVRTESEGGMNYRERSSLANGLPGRVKRRNYRRKKAAAAAAGGGGADA